MPSMPRWASVSHSRSRLHSRAGSGVRLKRGPLTRSAPTGSGCRHSTAWLAAVSAAALAAPDLDAVVDQRPLDLPAERCWLAEVVEEEVRGGCGVLARIVRVL